MDRINISIIRKIKKPAKTHNPASSSLASGMVCKKTSPSSPPAASACPMERIVDPSMAPSFAKPGNAKRIKLGAREMKPVETNAATKAEEATMISFRLKDQIVGGRRLVRISNDSSDISDRGPTGRIPYTTYIKKKPVPVSSTPGVLR